MLTYPELKLTKEQTAKVLSLNDLSSFPPHFSEWENLDYEYYIYSRVLDKAQLPVFEKIYQKNIENVKAGLRVSDVSDNELAYYTDLRSLFEAEFIRIVSSEEFLQFSESTDLYFEKLKTQYRHFLTNKCKELTTDHFRHARIYQNKRLKASFLDHSLHYLIPDIEILFDGLKIISETDLDLFLNEYKITDPNKKGVEFSRKTIDRINRSAEMLLKKHLETGAISYYKTPRLPIRDEFCVLTILLIDKHKYGLDHLASLCPESM